MPLAFNIVIVCFLNRICPRELAGRDRRRGAAYYVTRECHWQWTVRCGTVTLPIPQWAAQPRLGFTGLQRVPCPHADAGDHDAPCVRSLVCGGVAALDSEVCVRSPARARRALKFQWAVAPWRL